MGSLDKSNPRSENLESEHATTNNGREAIVNPATVHGESIQFGSDSSPVQDLDTEHDKSSLKLEADDQLANPNEESKDSPSTPLPNDSISERPPIQLMERQETPKYRIPSHVFARKKSTNPGDWSMASNESLFSIQMGSIKLYNQDSFLFKPEELDLGQIPQFDEVNNHGSSMLDEHEPTNSDYKKDCQSTADSSSISSRSFMFPVVAGETEKGGSPNPHGSVMGVPEEPKVGPGPEPEGSEVKEEPKNATPFISWFPCFRYCRCCCY